MALVMLLPAAAFAQDAGSAFPTNWQGWVVFALVAILSAGIPILRQVAPKTENQIDDKVLEGLLKVKSWVEDNQETIDRWKDPDDDATPPTPSNPAGVS